MQIGLELRNSQHLALTPQLQQAIRILQLPTVDLLQEITEELERNPLLEAEEASRAEEVDCVSDGTEMHWESGSTSSEIDIIDLKAAPVPLSMYLEEQLACLREPENLKTLALWLIGSLDEDGYLEADLPAIAADSPYNDRSEEDWHEALLMLQTLDPAGVGARSLQERLTLQIASLTLSEQLEAARTLAARIVTDGFEFLSKKNYLQLRRSLHCTEEELKRALHLIAELNPHPTAQWQDDTIQYVIPEISVIRTDKRWKAQLIDSALPTVKLNTLYSEAISRSESFSDKRVWMGRISEAKQFIRNLSQRRKTLLDVATLIVEKQQSFFDCGVEAMRPLVLRDIAEELGLHESTVSRVTNGKYLTCRFGNFEFKYFFSTGLAASQTEDAVSSVAVKAAIKSLIAEENPKKPLSDAKIAEALDKRGMHVARRTVSKYREQLGIESTSLRKRL